MSKKGDIFRNGKVETSEASYRKRLDSAEPKVEPLQVKVERGDFEEAYRNFKALFQRERVIGLLKEKQFYEKPSEKKRRKKRQALERKLAADAREKMMKTGEWDRRMKHKQRKREERVQKRKMRRTKDEENDRT